MITTEQMKQFKELAIGKAKVDLADQIASCYKAPRIQATIKEAGINIDIILLAHASCCGDDYIADKFYTWEQLK